MRLSTHDPVQASAREAEVILMPSGVIGARGRAATALTVGRLSDVPGVPLRVEGTGSRRRVCAPAPRVQSTPGLTSEALISIWTFVPSAMPGSLFEAVVFIEVVTFPQPISSPVNKRGCSTCLRYPGV